MIIDGSKQFSNYFQINIIFHDDRRYFKEMKFHSRKGEGKNSIPLQHSRNLIRA